MRALHLNANRLFHFLILILFSLSFVGVLTLMQSFSQRAYGASLIENCSDSFQIMNDYSQGDTEGTTSSKLKFKQKKKARGDDVEKKGNCPGIRFFDIELGDNVANVNWERTAEYLSKTNRSLQRLSSGLRINSADDDAAGLAIPPGRSLKFDIYFNNGAVIDRGSPITYTYDDGNILTEPMGIKNGLEADITGTIEIPDDADWSPGVSNTVTITRINLGPDTVTGSVKIRLNENFRLNGAEASSGEVSIHDSDNITRITWVEDDLQQGSVGKIKLEIETIEFGRARMKVRWRGNGFDPVKDKQVFEVTPEEPSGTPEFTGTFQTPATAVAGEPVRITQTVTNTGNASGTFSNTITNFGSGVRVEALPIDCVAYSNQLGESEVDCPAQGEVIPGESEIRDFTIVYETVGTRSIKMIVILTDGQATSFPGDPIDVEAATEGLNIFWAQPPDNMPVGEALELHFTMENTSSLLATNVRFLLAFGGLAVDIGRSSISKGTIQTSADGAALGNVDELEPGEIVDISLTVTTREPGTLQINSTVSADQFSDILSSSEIESVLQTVPPGIIVQSAPAEITLGVADPESLEVVLDNTNNEAASGTLKVNTKTSNREIDERIDGILVDGVDIFDNCTALESADGLEYVCPLDVSEQSQSAIELLLGADLSPETQGTGDGGDIEVTVGYEKDDGQSRENSAIISIVVPQFSVGIDGLADTIYVGDNGVAEFDLNLTLSSSANIEGTIEIEYEAILDQIDIVIVDSEFNGTPLTGDQIESGLNQIGNLLQRLKELAVQASSANESSSTERVSLKPGVQEALVTITITVVTPGGSVVSVPQRVTIKRPPVRIDPDPGNPTKVESGTGFATAFNLSTDGNIPVNSVTVTYRPLVTDTIEFKNLPEYSVTLDEANLTLDLSVSEDGSLNLLAPQLTQVLGVSSLAIANSPEGGILNLFGEPAEVEITFEVVTNDGVYHAETIVTINPEISAVCGDNVCDIGAGECDTCLDDCANDLGCARDVP